MHKPRWSIAFAVTAIAVALAAASCQPAQIGSRFVKSEKVGASGSTISVTESDSLALQGAKLEVAAGAVSADTTITLEVGLSDVVPTASAAGPVAVWEPSGLKFLKPVKMTLPLKLQAGQTDEDLTIMVVEGDGTRTRIERSKLELDATKTHVSFMVSGFTAFQPMSGARCMTTADCITGETCVSNVCQAPGGAGGGAGGAGGGNPAGSGGGTSGTGGGTTGTGGGTTGTGGGTAGTGGGTAGTGGGSSSCGTCAPGETCWGGTCTNIPCDPVRGCPMPLTCIANSCQ